MRPFATVCAVAVDGQRALHRLIFLRQVAAGRSTGSTRRAPLPARSTAARRTSSRIPMPCGNDMRKSGSQPSMPNVLRDDARARREVEEFRRQLVQVHRQQEQRHHRWPSRCRPRTCRPARTAPCRPRRLPSRASRDNATMSGLYSTPCAAGAELRRRDDVAAIAGAEIDHVVGGRDLRDLHHLVDHLRWRGHPHDIFSGLAAAGNERLLRFFLSSNRRRSTRDQRQARAMNTNVRIVCNPCNLCNP